MQKRQTAPALVKKAAGGDEAAFSQLVRENQSCLYAAALAITRHEQDALDAVQDAVLKGWQKLPTLREPQYFRTWLTRIAINCALNKAKRRPNHIQLMEDTPAPGTDYARRMDVRRAIDGLDEKTRVCVMLYYLEDMPIAEIAKAVGILQGTVKSRLHRARTQLREALRDYE